MLTKCANPTCSASFHRLGDGRLFRLEPDPTFKLCNPKIEYFWLCPTCSAVMMLRIDSSGTVVTAPFPLSVHDEHEDAAPISVAQSRLLPNVDSHLRVIKSVGSLVGGKRQAMADDPTPRHGSSDGRAAVLSSPSQTVICFFNPCPRTGS